MKYSSGIFLLFALVALTAFSTAYATSANFNLGSPYSALKQSGQWTIQEGCEGGVACATLGPSDNGWYQLNLQTYPTHSDYDQASAAGFLEGALTQELIWYSWLNFANGTSYTYSAAFGNFIQDNLQWLHTQVNASFTSPAESSYWVQVGLVLAQFEGLYAGYSAFAPEEQQIDYDDFVVYELSYEIGDIAAAVGEAEVTLNFDSHCSVLVKPSADGQNLFASHDTWDVFTSMLRIYKHYDTAFASSVVSGMSFSSYPGMLPSGDDFYITSANMAIMETTNEVMNTTLYTTYTTTQTVPYWIRVIVANRMATSGEAWTSVFAQYNSGTYNNQWIVVDYKLFTPGKPLQPGTLWIAEQIPGFVVAQDQTSYLVSNGYWASYNVPFYTFIYNISGYPSFYEKYGNEYSWSECARAQIFRRDEGAVQTLEDMKKIMRYNEWQTDPLALQDACRGISARCDLNPPWVVNPMNAYSPFGGTDSKLTSNLLAPARVAATICGPTWDSQSPFAWTNQWAGTPHYGHPTVFDFEWIIQVPQQP